MAAEGRPPDEQPVDEQPIDDRLADYWKGDFTLRDAPDAPDPAVPAHAGLGPSGISVRGRDLVVLLEPAYRAFTA